ncbi:flagellar biosynthetic protein FliO [Roseimaritima ulvae]|uniref:Flagellar protein n=1 Tax=Roseimaritima ulvae TaxID=980254 RepID=A0A5B9QZN2_9BACT|nr:flagellar biosynthetic protein FliO [Roseimaritima ulvae]QEG42885.1 Flagellar biosynthesis protein, FliO [Roseimaritima ulvae]
MNARILALPIIALLAATLAEPVAAQSPPAAQAAGSPVAASSRGIVLDATESSSRSANPTTANWESEHDFAAARQASQSDGSSPFRSRVKDAENTEGGTTLPLTTVFSSLAIVLGLFGALVWVLRRSGGAGLSNVSKDTLQVLGRAPLAPRQNIVLVRCGRRVLVLAVGGTNTSTLAEITDPDEINELLAGCGGQGGRQQFMQTLQAMGQERPASPGFVGSDDASKKPRRNSLFASA